MRTREMLLAFGGYSKEIPPEKRGGGKTF